MLPNSPAASQLSEVPSAPPSKKGWFAEHWRLWAVIGTAVLVLGVPVAGMIAVTRVQQTAHQPAVYTAKLADIRIGNVGEYSIFNLIAAKNGYFKEHGLNATITEYTSGPPAVADMFTDKVDVVIAGDFVAVNNIFNHKNLRILTQVSQQDSFSLVGLKANGIADAASLKGKKIAVTEKSSGEFFLLRYLALNGLQPSDITEVNATPAQIESDLTSGNVDAVVTFEPHVYNLQTGLGDKVVSWSVQGNAKTITLLCATNEYIKAHPQVVVQYLQALAEAETYLKQHPQGAKDILGQTRKYDAAYVGHIWPKFNFSLTLDQELLLTMEDQARFAIENKVTTASKVPNYLDYIYFDGLEKAKPDGVDIIH